MRDWSQAKQPDLDYDAILVSLLFSRCPSTAHLSGFLLLLSENSRIFQGDAEPKPTLADHVFKMKLALHSQLSMSANSKWSKSNSGFLVVYFSNKTICSSTENNRKSIYIFCRFERSHNAGNCKNKEKRIKTRTVAVISTDRAITYAGVDSLSPRLFDVCVAKHSSFEIKFPNRELNPLRYRPSSRC